jgi:cytochrome c-type biogenesis protein CcmH
MRRNACTLILMWMAFTAVASATGEPDPYADRMRSLTQELRCLVCQNQTLADSDAELAIDLRREIRELMQAGSSDAQITEFLVARYGDFVRYRPPVNPNTLLLWIAPALLAGAGIWSLLRTLRRQQLEHADATDADGECARNILSGIEGTG